MVGLTDAGVTRRDRPGARVGAWLDADTARVRLFGYGVYVGDEVPLAGPGLRGLCHWSGRSSPKIVLDDGAVVYGCECWWGAEETARAQIGGRAVEMVSISAYLESLLIPEEAR